MDMNLSFKERMQVRIKNNKRITFKDSLFITSFLIITLIIISFI
ncbi:hypothetical protein GCM10008904_18830 [Paraclostridium ghonii]